MKKFYIKEIFNGVVALFLMLFLITMCATKKHYNNKTHKQEQEKP